jgi:hypothetical protein
MSGSDCWLKLDDTYTHTECNTDRYILAYANSDGYSHANGYTKSYIHSDCDINRDIHT